MGQNVLSIFQVNEYIRTRMDEDILLSQVAVRGEISNYKKYPSGHHYFTLKDDNSALRCVMFRGNALSLRFQPQNGMKVIAFGRITVYPRDGIYQLYTSAIVLDGAGDLHAAFEQLKAKLAAEGLFEQSHKKMLPRFPQRIGIVTSSAGAAVHDMLKILRRRFPVSEARLFPVRVQGAEAPGEIATAIAYANRYKLCDVLIVGRGGGSMEDLWAFNDELVAHAIYDSEIPVVSAVGHEPDVTISDYVADVRAATPTHAAELVVPDMQSLNQQIDSMYGTLASSFLKRISSLQDRLNRITIRPVMQGPGGYITLKEKELEHLDVLLNEKIQKTIRENESNFASLCGKLDAMSPLKVLNRGYSIAETQEGEVITSAEQISIGETVKVVLHDGSISATVFGKESNYGTGNDI